MTAVFDPVLHFDMAVYKWIEAHLWCKFLDVFNAIVTTLGEKGIIWMLLIVVLLCFRKTRKIGMVAGIALVLNVLSVNIILKDTIERLRPFNLGVNPYNESYAWWVKDYIYPDWIKMVKPDSFSFPSGHTATAFAVATGCCYGKKRWLGISTLVFSCIMGFSRIYLHVHYTTDVLGGLVIGILCGLLAMLCFKIIEKPYDKIENNIYNKISAKRSK